MEVEKKRTRSFCQSRWARPILLAIGAAILAIPLFPFSPGPRVPSTPTPSTSSTEAEIETDQGSLVGGISSENEAIAIRHQQPNPEMPIPIVERIPDSVPAPSRDLQIANSLRQWAWQNTKWCSGSALIDQRPEIRFYERDAAEIFTFFAQDSGGVWCGGTAYALKALYEANGFRSWTFDYGIPGTMTHVVTVVEVEHEGLLVRTIQDATFNHLFVSEDDRPIDVRDLCQLVAQKELAGIRIQTGDFSNPPEVLVHPEDHFPFQYIVVLEDPHEQLPNGLTKYRSRLTLESFAEHWANDIAPSLHASGHDPDPMSLLAFPLRWEPPDLFD